MAFCLLTLIGQAQEPHALWPQSNSKPAGNLHHLVLELEVNVQTRQVSGAAKWQFSAASTTIDTLWLHARNLQVLNCVSENSDTLKFRTVGDSLGIELWRQVKSSDTAAIVIHYQTQKLAVADSASRAFAGHSGLYWIGNNDGLPTQVWSQGQCDNNRAWFPSIDVPAEKFTQEIAITVPGHWACISNGRLKMIEENTNGTRTHHWAQLQPHSNYLVMVAAGEFVETKGLHPRVDLSYFTRAEHASWAASVFSHTAAMLDYFEQRLGVPFPWDKYYQVVVSNFVSGAMENTSATVLSEYVMRSPAALVDNRADDVIAHELFHQWFGNLVTCESWSQLVLNEGLATYGEMLWVEHTEGPARAAMARQKFFAEYQHDGYSVPLIGRTYHHPDELFDGHSYQKGALVFHWLRQTVGDSLFFESLKHYLQSNALGSAELDHLRFSFETVCGTDLSGFFSQWFYRAGHPQIVVGWTWNDRAQKIAVEINQAGNPFSLPLPITIYHRDGRTEHRNFWISRNSDTLHLLANEKPFAIIADPFGNVPGTVSNQHSVAALKHLCKPEIPAFTRLQAVEELIEKGATDSLLLAASRDDFWPIRIKTAKSIVSSKLWDAAIQLLNDTMPAVRSATLMAMAHSDWLPEQVLLKTDSMVSDPSAMAATGAMSIGARHKRPRAAAMAMANCQHFSGYVLETAASLMAQAGNADSERFFETALTNCEANNYLAIMEHFTHYAEAQNSEAVWQKLIATASQKALKGEGWEARFGALQTIKAAEQWFGEQLKLGSVANEHDYEYTLARLAMLREELEEIIRFDLTPISR